MIGMDDTFAGDRQGPSGLQSLPQEKTFDGATSAHY